MPTRTYTQKDVIRDLGIHPDTLRRYERKGLLPAPKRNRLNNYRVYTEADVARIRAVFASAVEEPPSS